MDPNKQSGLCPSSKKVHFPKKEKKKPLFELVGLIVILMDWKRFKSLLELGSEVTSLNFLSISAGQYGKG